MHLFTVVTDSFYPSHPANYSLSMEYLHALSLMLSHCYCSDSMSTGANVSVSMCQPCDELVTSMGAAPALSDPDDDEQLWKMDDDIWLWTLFVYIKKFWDLNLDLRWANFYLTLIETIKQCICSNNKRQTISQVLDADAKQPRMLKMGDKINIKKTKIQKQDSKNQAHHHNKGHHWYKTLKSQQKQES